MINYNEDSLVRIIFHRRGSVGFRACMFAVPAALFSLFLVLSEELSGIPGLRTLAGTETLQSSQLWAASTAMLGVLLGFRTNRAMARFWEGTSLLHQMRAEWFDSVSCCVTFSRGAVPDKPVQVKAFRHTIVRLMSLCHGSALEEIAGLDAKEQHVIDPFGLDNATLMHLKECKSEHDFNRVEVLLHLIQSLITKNLDDGVLKIAPPILSRVYQTLSRGFVNILNAKKIADTRFPFPYAQTIASLLMIHVIVTPFVMAELVCARDSHVVWAPVFTFVPLFGMFSMNYIGIELENPFGDDDNDLPLDHFQFEMNKCLLMLLQENADLMPGISDTRCIMDYPTLQKQMRNKVAGTYVPEGEATRRITSFSIFGDDGTEQDGDNKDRIISPGYEDEDHNESSRPSDETMSDAIKKKPESSSETTTEAAGQTPGCATPPHQAAPLHPTQIPVSLTPGVPSDNQVPRTPADSPGDPHRSPSPIIPVEGLQFLQFDDTGMLGGSSPALLHLALSDSGGKTTGVARGPHRSSPVRENSLQRSFGEEETKAGQAAQAHPSQAQEAAARNGAPAAESVD